MSLSVTLPECIIFLYFRGCFVILVYEKCSLILQKKAPEAIVHTVGHGPKMEHNELWLRMCFCGFLIYSSHALWPIHINPMEWDVVSL